ncbi:hypothetical protein SADUNF_Sadunf18G0099900 [Salix dunnii]|uniref:TBC1 domain family member 15 n=1 Tax=Salix dunnii TaxID=1413687 RepID=A0A835J8S4_9ROSI|nr:hypothetical protein SADUNF_Sadunf18G0099900 [Salix dunnii]
MQEPELYDLSDDADYAASLQQESASMMTMRSDSGESTSSSVPEGAEVVYLKDNVTIHPTQYASERIDVDSVQRADCECEAESLYHKGRVFYGCEVHSSIYSDVWVAVHYCCFVIRCVARLAYPSLYLYNGGVKEFLATIKQHVFIVRSLEDANVFLVNDFQNPFQKTLYSLELPVSIASGPSASVSDGGEYPSFELQGRIDGSIREEIPGPSQNHGRQTHKSHDPARDLTIQVLEKFSLVTKFARDTSSQLFRESNSNGHGAIERSSSHSPHDIPNDISMNAKVAPGEGTVPSDPLEFDKMALVWGKPRQPPLGSEEMAIFLDSEGRVMDSIALKKRIFYGGVEHSTCKEVWPLLLGYHAYDSTYAEREYLRSTKKSEYETVKQQWQCISTEQAKRFTKYRERKGLIDKDVVRTDRTLSFYEGDDNANVNILRDILLTYSFYDFDLGYCQGMSDLLSPILFVMEDESEAFWCFVALMKRLGPNFNRDQNGMHSQLFAISKLVELLDSPLHNYFKQNDCLNYFFCFRWVLIQFKREFEYKKTMRLWEVLWTHYLSEHLHLYVCVAILKRYRNKIRGEHMDFDTLLKFINELSGHIDLDSILRDAEALCICAGENGAACIPPGTPPSLPIENENALLHAQEDEML